MDPTRPTLGTPDGVPAQPASPPAAKKRATGLYTIIAIKLGKGLLFLLLALGIFTLIDEDLESEFRRFIVFINMNPDREFIAALGRNLDTITPANVRFIASGALLYSLLLFVETGGLMARNYWAVWLAIGETAFFIPIEIFDLLRHFSWVVTGILVVNILIVGYLVRNRDRLFHHHPHPHPPPGSPG
jgi:uncharacterized membrane protein (DUF2068 family)